MTASGHLHGRHWAVFRGRRQTGMEMGMEEPYTEGVATHGGPEPWKAPG